MFKIPDSSLVSLLGYVAVCVGEHAGVYNFIRTLDPAPTVFFVLIVFFLAPLLVVPPWDGIYAKSIYLAHLREQEEAVSYLRGPAGTVDVVFGVRPVKFFVGKVLDETLVDLVGVERVLDLWIFDKKIEVRRKIADVCLNFLSDALVAFAVVGEEIVVVENQIVVVFLQPLQLGEGYRWAPYLMSVLWEETIGQQVRFQEGLVGLLELEIILVIADV